MIISYILLVLATIIVILLLEILTPLSTRATLYTVIALLFLGALVANGADRWFWDIIVTVAISIPAMIGYFILRDDMILAYYKKHDKERPSWLKAPRCPKCGSTRLETFEHCISMMDGEYETVTRCNKCGRELTR